MTIRTTTKVASAIAILIGTSSLLLFSLIAAADSAPLNGTFNSNLAGWTKSGDPLAFWWDGSTDHTGNGGGVVGVGTNNSYPFDNQFLSSTTVYASATWELHLFCTSPNNHAINVGVVAVGQPLAAPYQFACSDGTWGERVIQGIAAGSYYIVLHPSVAEGTVYVDDVSAIGASNAPNGTPTPTAVPTGVSGGNALARVTVTAATPYYSTSGINGVIPYNQPGSGTIQDLNSVEITTKQAGFCLPEGVTRFVSDVNLCFSIPLYEFTAFKVLGINILPMLAMIAVGVLVAFLIRNLQEK